MSRGRNSHFSRPSCLKSWKGNLLASGLRIKHPELSDSMLIIANTVTLSVKYINTILSLFWMKETGNRNKFHVLLRMLPFCILKVKIIVMSQYLIMLCPNSNIRGKLLVSLQCIVLLNEVRNTCFYLGWWPLYYHIHWPWMQIHRTLFQDYMRHWSIFPLFYAMLYVDINSCVINSWLFIV